MIGRRGPEKPEAGYLEAALFCDWLGEHIWLSLIGRALEAGANTEEAGSDRAQLALGPSQPRPRSGFPSRLPQRRRVGVLLSHTVWPVSHTVPQLGETQVFLSP